MRPEQIEQVQESFRGVLPIQDKAAALFYDRLFELDPSLRPLFAHADMAAQGEKLMGALCFVVGSLASPGPMLTALRALAIRHRTYGVEETHYATVGTALLWTLEAGLGSRWNAALAESWADAYGLVSDVMIGAARDGNPARLSTAA